jgi:hypothetical protein
MREAELLNALAAHDPGIQLEVYRLRGSPRASLVTYYRPVLRAVGDTILSAALDVAKQMLVHPDCPPEVKAALEAYNRHSQGISL